jgi:hypothetical protein
MARIEHLDIVPDNSSINSAYEEMSTQPDTSCSTSELGQRVQLRYKIVTEGVNLSIVNPTKYVTIAGTNKVFAKKIVFKKKQNGSKKNFILRCTAILENSTDWDEIFIRYD